MEARAANAAGLGAGAAAAAPCASVSDRPERLLDAEGGPKSRDGGAAAWAAGALAGVAGPAAAAAPTPGLSLRLSPKELMAQPRLDPMPEVQPLEPAAWQCCTWSGTLHTLGVAAVEGRSSRRSPP